MNQETDMLSRSIREFGRRVTGVKPEDWNKPTPDANWTVRDLVRHGLESVLWVSDVLAGRTIREVGSAHEVGQQVRGLQSKWLLAADEAIGKINEFTDYTRAVHLSYGDFPARTYLQHQVIDLTIHSWDLARAIGVDERLDDELVKAAYGWFESQADDWRAADIMAPAVWVPFGSNIETKLIALSGRNPAKLRA